MQFCNMREQSQACLSFAEHAAKSTKSIMQYGTCKAADQKRPKRHKFGRDVISSLVRLRLAPHEITGHETYIKKAAGPQPTASIKRMVAELEVIAPICNSHPYFFWGSKRPL